MTKPLEQAARELASAIKSREERDVRAQIGYVVAVGTMGESRLSEIRLADDTIIQAYIPSNLSLDFGDQVLVQKMRQGRWAVVSGGGNIADRYSETWSASDKYKKGDQVRHNNKVWIAVKRNGPDTPSGVVEPGTNNAIWKKYTEDGTPGEKGDKGPKGIDRKGEWLSGTSYVVDDVVRYRGNHWICIQDHTSSAQYRPGKDAGDEFWDLFVEKGGESQGTWDPQAEYELGDIVTYNGSTYRYVKRNSRSSTATPGTDETMWKKVADRGSDGTPGDKGEKGDKGNKWRSAWSSNNVWYDVDDVVKYDGHTWICINAHYSGMQKAPGASDPNNNNPWEKYTDKGDKGDTGNQGPQGRKGSQFRGAYNQNTVYDIDDVVRWAKSDGGDRKLYISLQVSNQGRSPTNTNWWDVYQEPGEDGSAGPQGASGPKGETGKKGSQFRGAYSPNTTYATDDVVRWAKSDGGDRKLYISLVDGNTGNPLTGNKWDVYQEPGEDGASGPQGPSGSKGDTGKKGSQFRGAYNPNTVYAQDDVVRWAKSDGGDRKLYISLVDSNQGSSLTGNKWQVYQEPGEDGSVGPQGAAGAQGGKGDNGPTGPKGYQFKSENWNKNALYNADDVVVFEDETYVCLSPVTTTNNVDPDEDTRWKLLIARAPRYRGKWEQLDPGANATMAQPIRRGDVVRYRSGSDPYVQYIAQKKMATRATVLPFSNTANWLPYGEDGASGPQGSTGPQGITGRDTGLYVIYDIPLVTLGEGSVVKVNTLPSNSNETNTNTNPWVFYSSQPFCLGDTQTYETKICYEGQNQVGTVSRLKALPINTVYEFHFRAKYSGTTTGHYRVGLFIVNSDSEAWAARTANFADTSPYGVPSGLTMCKSQGDSTEEFFKNRLAFEYKVFGTDSSDRALNVRLVCDPNGKIQNNDSSVIIGSCFSTTTGITTQASDIGYTSTGTYQGNIGSSCIPKVAVLAVRSGTTTTTKSIPVQPVLTYTQATRASSPLNVTTAAIQCTNLSSGNIDTDTEENCSDATAGFNRITVPDCIKNKCQKISKKASNPNKTCEQSNKILLDQGEACAIQYCCKNQSCYIKRFTAAKYPDPLSKYQYKCLRKKPPGSGSDDNAGPSCIAANAACTSTTNSATGQKNCCSPNRCISGVCQGCRNTGQACSATEDCCDGLSCKSGTCKSGGSVDPPPATIDAQITHAVLRIKVPKTNV